MALARHTWLERLEPTLRYLTSPRTAEQLAEHLKIDKQASQRWLRELSADGWVRVVDHITPKGPGRAAWAYLATKSVVARKSRRLS